MFRVAARLSPKRFIQNKPKVPTLCKNDGSKNVAVVFITANAACFLADQEKNWFNGVVAACLLFTL